MGYALYVSSYLQVPFLLDQPTILMSHEVQSISTPALAGLSLPRVPFSALPLDYCGLLKVR